MGVPNNRSHVRTSPVTISIHDLFSKINSNDIDFLKYIPNGFLNAEQVAAKNKAIGDVKNSDRDTLCNTLTEAQQAYFAESKVRDENGNLKVMYRGTPNATYKNSRIILLKIKNFRLLKKSQSLLLCQ